MDIRNIWSYVPIPEHKTTDEILTVPDDAPSIQELFERAARGESLGGSYDEYEDDSYFDMSYDPDMQDPLLRESLQNDELDRIKSESVTLRKTKAKRTKTNSKDDTSSKEASALDEGTGAKDKTVPPDTK